MKLFNHQQKALILGREGNLALFHQCGCGKTCTALNIIKHWKAKGVVPALVVCPLSIIEAAWLEDCQKFTPELSIINLWSKKPAERKERLAEQADIYVANYETFKNLYQSIKLKGFGVLIVDESSKMKNPTSQITRALLSLAGLPMRKKGSIKYQADDNIIPHRYVLSGTPAPNDESEYWAQLKFITGSGNKCFNDNYYAFRGRYFYSISIGLTGQKIFRFRKSMQQELQDTMQPFVHVVKKTDALDLPEQTHQIRKIQLTGKERRTYETMKTEKILQFQDEVVLSRTALTEIMKLRQLTSGFAYTDTGFIQTGKSKLNELKNLLEEIGEQTIIWANFKYEIRQLRKELPDSSVLWSENVERDKIIKDFQSGTKKYLIANPQSAGHGLTFINCRYAVYYSLNYSYEMQKQSQERIHRIGQKRSCTYYYLIAENTIDEIIYKTIQKKENLSSTILDYLKGVGARGKKPETVRI